MELRVKVYKTNRNDMCQVCAKRYQCKYVFTNILPCSLYVGILRSCSHLDEYLKRQTTWHDEQCDFTREAFTPLYGTGMCEMCYQEHFGAREVK